MEVDENRGSCIGTDVADKFVRNLDIIRMVYWLISIEKSVYDPKSVEDGLRVLVMRYWPRGTKKDKVDVWYKELGTSPQLIRAWKSGRVSWPEFKRRYLAELKDKRKEPIIHELMERAKMQKLTLLCSCRDPTRCHRAILKQRIESSS